MISFRRLKDIREDNDMSQREIADILNVQRSAYSLWELGINIIPLKHLCTYADYFHVTIDYVIGLTNNKEIKIIKRGFDLELLGNNLRKIRLKHSLTQEAVGKILGVTQAAIARYENAEACISIANLYQFSKHFKTSLSSLCGKSKDYTHEKVLANI